MKIGLDIHGTITAHRSFFSEWTHLLRRDNELMSKAGQLVELHEVHVMTGPEFSKLYKGDLDNIWYSHFFSIVEHCQRTGVVVMHDGKGDPWMDQYEWNKAKGDYARKHRLDLVIDDSADYPKFFTTPIATFQSGKEWIIKAGKL